MRPLCLESGNDRRTIERMEASFWADCPLIHSDPEIVHGEPVFVGTRLPAAVIVDSINGYLEDGLTLDRAIVETLESFPNVLHGPADIRAVLDYCARALGSGPDDISRNA